MKNTGTILLCVILLVVLAVSFCGCRADEKSTPLSSVSSNVSQQDKIETAYREEISFALNTNETEKDEVAINKHVARLKAIDENTAAREGVSFVEYNAQIGQNGSLVVDGYLRNFSGSEIYNIECSVTAENSETQEYVARGHFEFPENIFGSLENGKSRPVRITYDSDNINVSDYDLSKLTFSAELTYSQK